MQTIIVTTACNVSGTAPDVIVKAFVPGDRVSADSPYYWPLRWSGLAVLDTLEDLIDDPIFIYDNIVVSDEDPKLAGPALWVQTFPNSDDYTIWIVED